MADLLEEIHLALSPKERVVLDWLLRPARANADEDWPENAVPSFSYTAHGITQEEFQKLKNRVRLTCRAILRC